MSELKTEVEPSELVKEYTVITRGNRYFTRRVALQPRPKSAELCSDGAYAQIDPKTTEPMRDGAPKQGIWDATGPTEGVMGPS